MEKYKNHILPFYILLAVFITSTVTANPLQKTKTESRESFTKSANDTVRIFNGKDLSNLVLILAGHKKNAGKFYKIKNGSIYFKAGYKGYLRTKETYSSYKLHAEWKWTDKSEKGNSGILIDIQSPDTVWPECIQINFKENHAGDLIAMNGAQFNEAVGKPNTTALMLNKSSENPKGQWNTCDIISKGDSILVYINNVLQNKATGIKVNKGKIGWQLETKPIALRNIYLIPGKNNS